MCFSRTRYYDLKNGPCPMGWGPLTLVLPIVLAWMWKFSQMTSAVTCKIRVSWPITNLNLNPGSIQFDQYDLGAKESVSETLLPHSAPENNSVFWYDWSQQDQVTHCWDPVLNEVWQPLVQKLLKISRWQWQRINPSTGLSWTQDPS